MSFQWSVVWESLPRLLDGALMTVWLTFATMALAIPGGLVLALMRLSPVRLVSASATAFVEFFRATPLILQLLDDLHRSDLRRPGDRSAWKSRA